MTQTVSKNMVPKFAHLQYQVLHELDISITEYFMLDMIYHLSGNGRYWCNKKLENIAVDMRLSRRAVVDNRDRLIERKLLIKGIGNRLKTSDKVQKVYYLDESSLQKSATSAKKVQNLHSKSANNVSKTSVENNRRITLEGGDNKNKENRGEFSPAKEKLRAMLKQKGILKSN